MKKFLLLTLTAFFIGLMSFNVNAATLPENAPVLGVDNPDTDFYSHWHPTLFGVNRTEDNALDIAITSGYGIRAGFETPYDISDFEMSLDLTYVDPNVVITTFFGSQGCYVDGNGATLSMEILKHTTESHKYLVSIQAGSGTHHVGFTETIVAEQGDWEDSAWVGYHVVAEDDTINIAIKNEGENSTITINGTDFTIATSKLYQDVADQTNQYFLIGAMNLDGSIQTVTANYVYDAARRDYYSETGTYGTFLSNLTNLETALQEDLTVTANLEAASAIKANMDETLLYTWDQSYLDDRYNAAYTTLADAIVLAGGDIVLSSFETEVEKLETAVLAITDYSTATAAVALETPTLDMYNNIDTTDFSSEQLTRLNTLKSRYDTAVVDMYTNIETLVQAQVTAYSNATTDLSTIELVKSALITKKEINTSLIGLLSNDKQTTLNGTIATADAALETATTVSSENWTVNDNTYVLNNDGALDIIFLENGLEGENGLFYTEEELDIRNFEMTINPNSIQAETGGWLSFGLMENAEIFSTADDSTVQNNKGLFFLIIPNEDGETARVEVYHLSLYCNRFFDAQLQETLTINITQAIDVKICTEYIEISGLEEEYMSITVGGQKMVSDLISVSAMRTSLDDYMGTLYVAAQSSSTENTMSVCITDINGKSPLESGLAVEFNEIPTTTASELSFDKASDTSVDFNFVASGEEITSVKIGDTVLETTDYTYSDDLLSINLSVIQSLEDGDYVVTVTTDGGEVSLDLTVSETITEPEPTNSIGTWVYIVSGVAIVAIAGVAVFLIGKRK